MFAKNKVVLALAILATTGVAQAAVIVGGPVPAVTCLLVRLERRRLLLQGRE
ncbi:hypothetical protein ERHA54_33760 [Erwinia rhapontici]|nr:hypothetical protein ERHA54_33760 [Erwinia rhapontici]